MPVFSYECEKCGASFERLVRSASEKVVCDVCGAPDPKRKLSRFAPAVSSSGRNNRCPAAAQCPSASSGACGCACGCHSHHH